LKWEYCVWPRRTASRWGHFLFWADRLVLKGEAFAVVLHKPRFRDILFGKYLDVIRVADLLGLPPARAALLD
jgi:hypothetical protein